MFKETSLASNPFSKKNASSAFNLSTSTIASIVDYARFYKFAAPDNFFIILILISSSLVCDSKHYSRVSSLGTCFVSFNLSAFISSSKTYRFSRFDI
jgi:hypothetical protein